MLNLSYLGQTIIIHAFWTAKNHIFLIDSLKPTNSRWISYGCLCEVVLIYKNLLKKLMVVSFREVPHMFLGFGFLSWLQFHPRDHIFIAELWIEKIRVASLNFALRLRQFFQFMLWYLLLKQQDFILIKKRRSLFVQKITFVVFEKWNWFSIGALSEFLC